VFRRPREFALIGGRIDIDKDILAHMDFKPIIEHAELMDKRIFIDEPMGLLATYQSQHVRYVTYDRTATFFSSIRGHVHPGQGRHRRAAPSVGGAMQENRQAGRRVHQL
jgi:hypothetical protein